MITATIPVIGWLLHSGDPFFVQSFPWVLLAPVLLGLQNGFRYALASSLCLLGGALISWRVGAEAMTSFPVSYALAVGLIGPVAGEYRDKWQRALNATSSENEEHKAKLDRFSRAHLLLEHSHDELEQRVAKGGPSLRALLERVRGDLERGAKNSLAGAGDSILRLFSHHAQVQMASVHPVRSKGSRGQDFDVVSEPVASLGKHPPVDVTHPMVIDSLETGELTCVHRDSAASRGRTPLACVPLIDSTGMLHGVVLVHEMPFLAMRDEHMMLLATMGGRIGDWLAEPDRATDSEEQR